MNILFINDLIVGGGVENVLYNVISYLETKKEYQISLLSLTDQKEDFEQRYSHKIKYLSYEPKWFQEKEAKRFSPYWFIKRSVTFLYRSFIIQKKYDVVIAIKEGHVMKLGNKIRANKKYAWVHVDYRYLYWTQYCFQSKKDELLCMSQYDNVVCVSNATKDSVCQVVGNPENLVVKMNPLNINNILEKSNTPVPQLDEYMDMKKSDIMILISVGRLDEQKGYIRLLNVCAKLNKLFDFELWIIGDGKDRDKLENKIEAFSLNNVVLWGNQSNPYPLIKKADWFISSSYWESYGLALQEALILGVPVLATTCPSFEECVSEKEAILVPNDEDALYDGLYRILSEPKLNQVYRENINRNRTHDHYFEGRMEAIEGLWKQNM